jgi:putative oxidoreductase
MNRVFLLDALPRSVDLGLLVLRVVMGGSLIALHGWSKLANFGTRSATFSDPLGVGSPVSLALAVVGEVVAPSFIVLGLGTRVAALISTLSMSVAFFLVHGAAISGPRNGELALMYLTAFVVLALADGGRFSLDARLARRA